MSANKKVASDVPPAVAYFRLKSSYFFLNLFYDLHNWTEVDEQELVYPITRDSSKRREEKKEEKAFSSSLIVHKMAGSRRENHFFSSRLSDFDLLLFRARSIFFSKIVDRPSLFVYSPVFSAASTGFDWLRPASSGFCYASPFSIIFAEESFFQPFLFGEPP